MKRLFVAIKLSENTTNEIRTWRGEFWRRSGFERWIAKQKGKADHRIRFVHEDDLHVTLVPPWETEHEDTFVEAFRACRIERSHRIVFRRVEYGPSMRRPRLIWVVGEASTSLYDLKDQLEMALFHEITSRAFLPHITLARFDPEQFHTFPAKTISENIRWEEFVRSVSLIESKQGASGRRYEVLADISFPEDV